MVAEAAALAGGLQTADAVINLLLKGWRICNIALNAAQTAEDISASLRDLDVIVDQLHDGHVAKVSDGATSILQTHEPSDVERAALQCRETIDSIEEKLGSYANPKRSNRRESAKARAPPTRKGMDSIKLALKQQSIQSLQHSLDRQVQVLLLCLSSEQRLDSKEQKQRLSELQKSLGPPEHIAQDDDPVQQPAVNSGRRDSEADINANSDPNDDEESRALFTAVQNGDVGAVDQLFEGGVDALTQYRNEWNLLHHSATLKETNMTHRLLDHAPELGAMRDLAGDTALHHSAKQGNEAQVDALLEYTNDVDVHAQNHEKHTALYDVVEQPWTEGREEIAKSLLGFTRYIEEDELPQGYERYDCVNEFLDRQRNEVPP